MSAAPRFANAYCYSDAETQPRVVHSDATFNLPLARLPSNSEANGGTLAITLMGTEHARNEAMGLINRRYAWRGYGSHHKFSGRQHETTFIATRDDTLIGTITLATDSARGLCVDATFPDEMKFFRRRTNTRLCELKKLAIETSAPSKPVLAALFNFVFIYGTNNYLGTDLFIEVNPRHAPVYEKTLGFQCVGPIKTNISVSAPSQLMWLPVSDIEKAINDNQHDNYKNTLYRYFYPKSFEERIISELNERGLRESVSPSR